MKQYKLIKLPEQFIIVTDDIIKEDELFLMGTELIYNSSLMTDEWVIAEQSQIDFNGFEDSVGYVDVEKLAEEKYLSYQEGRVDLNTGLKRLGFKEGFVKAQELSSKQFALNDIANYIYFVEDNYHYHDDFWYDRDTDEHISRAKMLDNYIKSVQPKKEWLVEIEMELNTDGLDRASYIPKLIDNKVRIIKIIA